MKDTARYSDLVSGDTFYIQDVRCTAFAERETYKDMLGRECTRLWARREDTGLEGWVTYGPGGVVRTRPHKIEVEV